jgi:hypothetical protein
MNYIPAHLAGDLVIKTCYCVAEQRPHPIRHLLDFDYELYKLKNVEFEVRRRKRMRTIRRRRKDVMRDITFTNITEGKSRSLLCKGSGRARSSFW